MSRRAICGRTCGCDDACPRAEAAAEDRRDGRGYSERDIDGMAEAEARNMVYGREP